MTMIAALAGSAGHLKVAATKRSLGSLRQSEDWPLQDWPT